MGDFFKRFTGFLLPLALVLFLAGGCGGGGGGGGDGDENPPEDTTAPTVTSRSPDPGAVNVQVNTLVTATFNEDIDAATVNQATFTLAHGGVPEAGVVAYDVGSKTATFTSSLLLLTNTLYTATLSAGIKDLAGNALAETTWNFTTGSGVDNTPPTIVTRQPAPGAVSVSTSATVQVTFSESMDAGTITAASFRVENPDNDPVAGAISYNNATRTVTLTPNQGLTAGTTFEVIVTTAVTDLAGNPLASQQSWTFTTQQIAGPPPPPF